MKKLFYTSLLAVSMGWISTAQAALGVCLIGDEVFQTEVTLYNGSAITLGPQVSHITVQQLVRGQKSGDLKTYAVELLNDYSKGAVYRVVMSVEGQSLISYGTLDAFAGGGSIYVNLLMGPAGFCQNLR